MYSFQKDDLVICKPEEHKRSESNNPFEIYARVDEVDRDRDKVRLDCYQKQGNFHLESRITKLLPLSEMEENELYQPMNEEEIIEFRDNLCKLLSHEHLVVHCFSVKADSFKYVMSFVEDRACGIFINAS